MRIGELADRAGVSTRALRYYEEQLLLSPQRTSGGQRFYPEVAVDRVKLIQELYSAGLGSRLIAALLPAIDARSVGPELLDSLLQERARIETKTAQLQAASERLDVLIALALHPDTASCPPSLDPDRIGTRQDRTPAKGVGA
ncbi:MerR family transcriptional regulator [Streptomyces nodosus]|uniref:MerR family transcriptional regulator n=1 Tax=Streptomyces nodosus TaxID=40318 RepID=A0A5P2WDG6_9ACTN|nr:MerR family transcriptional regulator [Streptomyces nodosus]MBB4795429.1 DNA-binding transcriptional MerR regulator [Streptomyces nodosus]QEV42377.1 MerR family transcriptional regulator [Streptomyces nodosus]